MGIENMDTQLFLVLNGDGGAIADFVMWYASAKLTWLPLYAAILWWVWRSKGLRFALLFLVVVVLFVVGADQTATFFKANFSRFRPTHTPELEGLVHTVRGYLGGNYGTVSSHAALTGGFALISSLVIRRWWFTLAMISWALLVSYSRIYLGVHYPLDILYGWCNGLLWAGLCYLLLRFTLKKLALKNN